MPKMKATRTVGSLGKQKVGFDLKKNQKDRPVQVSELERLRDRIEKLLKAPKEHAREIRKLRAKLKSAASPRIAGPPTRNFSGEAIRAARKFRGLRTAHLASPVKVDRATAIKRAVISFYGLK